MKIVNWQKYGYFPGVFAVLLWFIPGYLTIASDSTTSVIQRTRLLLLLSWIGIELYRHRIQLIQTVTTLDRYTMFPHSYWLIYAMVALTSAFLYTDGSNLWVAIYLVIFALLVILVTNALVNQPPHQRIVYLKRLWDLTILVLVLRLLFFVLGVSIAFEQAVTVVPLGTITLFRVRPDGFWGALNANTAGYFGALLLVVVVNRFKHVGAFRPAWLLHLYWFFIGCLSITALILAYSRTAFAALGVVGIIYVVSYRKYLWLAGIMLIVVVVGFQSNAITTYLMRGQDISTVGSFSNRWYIWLATLRAFQESPLVGYGYFGGERPILEAFMSRYYPGEPVVGTSHNAFLSVLLGTGLLGFLPFAAAFLLIGWHIINHFKLTRGQDGLYRLLANELFAVFLIIFISSLTLTTMVYVPINIRNLPLLALFVFAGLSTALLAKHSASVITG